MAEDKGPRNQQQAGVSRQGGATVRDPGIGQLPLQGDRSSLAIQATPAGLGQL